MLLKYINQLVTYYICDIITYRFNFITDHVAFAVGLLAKKDKLVRRELRICVNLAEVGLQ